MLQHLLQIGLSITLVGIIGLDAPGCLDDPMSSGKFASWPVDTAGYIVETLPMHFTASYVRGEDVYFGLLTGEIFQTNDRDVQGPWTSLGIPVQGRPKMVFASSSGVVFTSSPLKPVYRTADRGRTWQKVIDVPVWRMDEDDQGNLYAGDYIKEKGYGATLYKSTDGGVTWTVVFHDPDNHHIHTVRWDDNLERLYIAYGDRRSRGQAYSDDRGQTWITLASGPDQGDTDVGLTTDYILWLSDNERGNILRENRQTGVADTVLTGRQYMWFIVTQADQVYVGTMASSRSHGEGAALLASADQGQTWQKLIATPPSQHSYDQGLSGESRNLSANGWLYCSDSQQSYRVRRSSE